MVGDSDEDLFPEEDEDEEADSSQPTAQELRLERWRQLTQNAGGSALQEEEERQQEAESDSAFSPSAFPSWATRRFPDASVSQEEEPPSFSTQPHSLASAARDRGRTAPYRPLPADQLATLRARRAAASAATLSGWQSIRRHSYWLIPILLVAAFSLLLLVTQSRQVWAMFFIFAAVGLLQSAVLLYAPNDAFWAVGAVGGLLVFVSLTFFALFLPVFALILSILLFSLGGVALRERSYLVKEGTVAVMSFGKRYNRTLQPGFNLRVPGEKGLVVDMHNMSHDVRPPPIPLASGEPVLLSVSVNYHVIPEKASLAVQASGDWQTFIKQQLQTTVQEEVRVLSIDHFRHPGSGYTLAGALGAYAADESDEDDEDTSPLRHLNQHLAYAMRKKIEDRGVTVSSVRVLLLEGLPLPGSAQIAGQQPSTAHSTGALPGVLRGAGQIVEGSLQGSTLVGPSSRPAAPAEPVGQPAPPPHLPALPGVALPARAGIAPTDSLPEPVTLGSAQALAEIYRAVMDHRITDPITISRIIRQFEAVAADPRLSQEVEFDAAAGADLLIKHLYHLQTREHAAPPPQSDGGASPSSTLPEKG